MRTTLFLAFFLSVNSLFANRDLAPVPKNDVCLSCNVPDGLVAGSLTDSTATLNWNAVAGATQYTVEAQDEQNAPSVFHLEVNVSATSYVISGLQAGVLYKFKVRAHCANGQSDWSAWTFFNGNAGGNNGGSTGACAVPTGLTVSGISANAATLAWDAVPSAASYTIEIERNQPGAPWQVIKVSATNTFQMTGLDASTRYKFKVRTNCTGGGHSDWASWRKFKTAVSLSGNGNSSMVSHSSGNTSTATLLPGFDLQVWPNPVQSEVTVQLQNLNLEPATLRLFNLSGNLVQEQHIQSEGAFWEGSLGVSDLPNGLYLLQTVNGTASRTVKLVVSH